MKKKIKIAVVGIGLMGSQHLKALNLSKRAKLHSIVDLNKKSGKHWFNFSGISFFSPKPSFSIPHPQA